MNKTGENENLSNIEIDLRDFILIISDIINIDLITIQNLERTTTKKCQCKKYKIKSKEYDNGIIYFPLHKHLINLDDYFTKFGNNERMKFHKENKKFRDVNSSESNKTRLNENNNEYYHIISNIHNLKIEEFDHRKSNHYSHSKVKGVNNTDKAVKNNGMVEEMDIIPEHLIEVEANLESLTCNNNNLEDKNQVPEYKESKRDQHNTVYLDHKPQDLESLEQNKYEKSINSNSNHIRFNHKNHDPKYEKSTRDNDNSMYFNHKNQNLSSLHYLKYKELTNDNLNTVNFTSKCSKSLLNNQNETFLANYLKLSIFDFEKLAENEVIRNILRFSRQNPNLELQELRDIRFKILLKRDKFDLFNDEINFTGILIIFNKEIKIKTKQKMVRIGIKNNFLKGISCWFYVNLWDFNGNEGNISKKTKFFYSKTKNNERIINLKYSRSSYNFLNTCFIDWLVDNKNNKLELLYRNLFLYSICSNVNLELLCLKFLETQLCFYQKDYSICFHNVISSLSFFIYMFNSDKLEYLITLISDLIINEITETNVKYERFLEFIDLYVFLNLSKNESMNRKIKGEFIAENVAEIIKQENIYETKFEDKIIDSCNRNSKVLMGNFINTSDEIDDVKKPNKHSTSSHENQTKKGSRLEQSFENIGLNVDGNSENRQFPRHTTRNFNASYKGNGSSIQPSNDLLKNNHIYNCDFDTKKNRDIMLPSKNSTSHDRKDYSNVWFEGGVKNLQPSNNLLNNDQKDHMLSYKSSFGNQQLSNNLLNIEHQDNIQACKNSLNNEQPSINSLNNDHKDYANFFVEKQSNIFSEKDSPKSCFNGSNNSIFRIENDDIFTFKDPLNRIKYKFTKEICDLKHEKDIIKKFETLLNRIIILKGKGYESLLKISIINLEINEMLKRNILNWRHPIKILKFLDNINETLKVNLNISESKVILIYWFKMNMEYVFCQFIDVIGIILKNTKKKEKFELECELIISKIDEFFKVIKSIKVLAKDNIDDIINNNIKKLSEAFIVLLLKKFKNKEKNTKRILKILNRNKTILNSFEKIIIENNFYFEKFKILYLCKENDVLQKIMKNPILKLKEISSENDRENDNEKYYNLIQKNLYKFENNMKEYSTPIKAIFCKKILDMNFDSLEISKIHEFAQKVVQLSEKTEKLQK